MECSRRVWRPKLSSATASARLPQPWRCRLRTGFVTLRSALRTSGSNAPLSLNDIIAFESQLPSLVQPEQRQEGTEQEAGPAPAERRVDQLIDRASRVLREVNSVLASPSSSSPSSSSSSSPSSPPGRNGVGSAGSASGSEHQEQRAGSTGPTAGQDAAVAAGAGSGDSELSRAVFGGSAQLSEREGARRRQALQRTLEAGVPAGPQGVSSSPPAAGQPAASPSSGPASSGASSSPSSPAAVAPTLITGSDDREGPAWAQALFAASSAASATPSSLPPSSSSSTATTSTSNAPTSSAASASLFASPSSAGRRSEPTPGSLSTSRGIAAAADSVSSPSSITPPPLSSSSIPQPQQQQQRLQPLQQPSPSPSPSSSGRLLAEWAPLAFAEVDLSIPTELTLKSEKALVTEAARTAVLPPLQSVVDLTAAVRPPTRGLDLGGSGAGATATSAAPAAAVSVSEEEVVQGGALGRRLADGAGRLADGTRFEKLSGTDTGPDGYVKKWEVLRGVTGDGRVQWEECWWQASNRYGLREMGAFKKGTAESGASWVEEWREVLRTHPHNLRLAIERTAHKWARDENSDEWEEKWGECYEEAGRVHKYADKWAKAGINVWHERWGEDYDGRGACQKWTDKWAERLLPDGGQEQWGDKWTETFGAGKGTKHGEVWSSNSGGSRYNRWWNEEHFGDGRVRKWGDSTSGEHWDTVENMDTYYNPVPHFGFDLAVSHSPQLWAVPLPAPDEGGGSAGDGNDDDGLGVGLGRL